MLSVTKQVTKRSLKRQRSMASRRRVKGKTDKGQLLMQEVDIDVVPTRVPLSVEEFLAKVNEAILDRRKQEIVGEMTKIHQRVVLALKHYGMSGTIEITPSEHEALNVSTLTRGYNASDKRSEIDRRQGLMQRIAEYLKSCNEKKNIIQEIEDWLQTYSLAGVPTADDLEATALFLKENNISIGEAFDHFVETVGDINTVGYKLLKEAGFLDSDDEDGSTNKGRAKKFVVPQIKPVGDESQFVADNTSLFEALEEIRLAIDHSVRAVKTNKQKTVMRNAHKQYRFAIKAIEKRVAASLEKDETILKLEVEINTLKNAKERLETEVAKKDKEIHKLDADLITTQAQMADVQDRQDILEEEVKDLQEMNERLENPPPSTPRVSIVSMRRQSTRVRVVESTPELRALRAELEETRTALEEQVARTGEFETQLLEEQLKKTILESKERLKEEEEEERAREEERMVQMKVQQELAKTKIRSLANDDDNLERQIARLKTELNCKDELIDFQDKSILSMKEELAILSQEGFDFDKPDGPKEKSHDAKRMMVKMRKSHEEELSRLKLHVESERKRGDADIRRLENSHQDQMANVHKQSIHLLRAINRFKGQVANILERESLPDAASDVRKMANLHAEDTHTDTRKLLNQMARDAVELLVAIEFKLSQSLMNKRLEVKDNSFARNFANRDLELQLTVTSKARQNAENMHEKLSQTKDQLKHAEAALIEMRKNKEKRMEGLSDRNERLMNQYKTMQKQLVSIQSECGESLRRKDKQMKGIEKRRGNLTKLVEEQKASINFMQAQLKQQSMDIDKRYVLNISNQYDNMMKIEEAYKQGLITHEMHQLTSGLIKQFMHLPELKLKVLCERYVAFRRLQDAKSQLKEQLSESLLLDRREELTGYLERVDEQLQQSEEVWQEKRKTLEDRRQQFFTDMNKVLAEMIRNSELLHVSQIPVERPGRRGTATPDMLPDGANALSVGGARRGSTLPHLVPSRLVGTNVAIGGSEESMWRVDLPALPPISQKGPALLSSKLMCMDINPELRAAHRVIRKIQNREPLNASVAEGYDYEDCVLNSLQTLLGRDDHLPPQRPTTPTTYKYINRPCQCGSLCASNACTSVK